MTGYVQNRLAKVALGMFVIVMVMLLSLEPSMGTEYQVGDQFEWSYNIDYDTWVSGKTFRAGDVLVFKYDPSYHNVVEVNKAGYDGCKFSPNKKTYNSGNDRVTLTSGTKYYICQYHCDYANQKIMIHVN